MDPVRYFGALILVGGLLALAIYLLKRLRLHGSARDRDSLEIIAHASLGTREKLVVVRFAGKRVLLGVTPGSISRLASARLDQADQQLAEIRDEL